MPIETFLHWTLKTCQKFDGGYNFFFAAPKMLCRERPHKNCPLIGLLAKTQTHKFVVVSYFN